MLLAAMFKNIGKLGEDQTLLKKGIDYLVKAG